MVDLFERFDVVVSPSTAAEARSTALEHGQSPSAVQAGEVAHFVCSTVTSIGSRERPADLTVEKALEVEFVAD